MGNLNKRGDGSLRVCYRPMRKEEFYGFNVDALLKALNSANRPRTFLFHGPTGCGKTSLARYTAMLINCDDSDGVNPCLQCDSCKAIMNNDQQLYRELNMADKTGIDETRNELKKLHTRPFKPGKKKVLTLDEAQQLTNAAQQGWLKTLEEPPEWSYIILCTTEPEKFRADVFNRLTTFQFHTLTKSDAVKFIMDVAGSENIPMDAILAGEIFDTVGGHPRELINALEKISLEGAAALNTLGVAGPTKTAKINDFINSLQSPNPTVFINIYYDLLNQMNGDTEAFRRALGGYAEKIIRSEAMKGNGANQKSILLAMSALNIVSLPIDRGMPWQIIPRITEEWRKLRNVN